MNERSWNLLSRVCASHRKSGCLQKQKISRLVGHWIHRFVVVKSLSCVQLCNHIDCSTPGFPVLHYLLEFVKIHGHWVGRKRGRRKVKPASKDHGDCCFKQIKRINILHIFPVQQTFLWINLLLFTWLLCISASLTPFIHLSHIVWNNLW